MKANKNFTVKDLEDFIKAQPDDRLVDMTQPTGDDDCGCVLVHFGRKLFHRHIKVASFVVIWNDRGQKAVGCRKVDNVIFNLVRKNPKNYGEIKKLLNLV